jgi:ribosomal RNA-processing protein 8
MFAVPGWSVSADTLKTQKEPRFTRSAPHYELNDRDENEGIGKQPRKRKRAKGEDKSNSNGLTVTDENLADLWKKYIEGRDTRVDEGEDGIKLESGKKRKRRREGQANETKPLDGSENHALAGQVSPEGLKHEGREHGHSATGGPGTKSLAESASDEVPPETSKGASQSLETKLSGKVKYQHRKLLALKKREQRARLQSTGSLPTSRPNPLNESTRNAGAEAPLHLNEGASNRTLPGIPADTYPTSTSSATALTPLQSQMRSKLIAARFRHLNETLYTSTSTNAFNLFTESPSSFASYHAGFRAQVSVWPQNPVDTFIAELKARAPLSRASPLQSQKKKWREKGKGKNKTDYSLPEASNDKPLAPLPRSRSGICTIADLGCGDAKLAASLVPFSTLHSLRLLSYDLSTGDGPNASLITVADLCQLPLKNGEVDVAVLCLALMGTNWVDGVEEVARAVRPGGEVWVAEIRSRFQRPIGTDKHAGPGKQRGNKKHKSANGEDDGDDDDDVDGILDNDLDTEPVAKGKTADIRAQKGEGQVEEIETRDIDPFVDIWRRRGFTLSGPIDQSNRMFVRMKFIKLATPEIKEGVSRASDDGPSQHKQTWTAKNKNKSRNKNSNRGYDKSWINDGKDPEKEKEEESKVLKPCVYKIR